MVIWARGLSQAQLRKLQHENLNTILSVPAYCSHYRRAIILLFYLDYETMIYAILATLLRLLKK